MQPVSLAQFSSRLSAVMPVMCTSMMRYEKNMLTAGTLTLPQFRLLCWLREHPEASMHEAAAAVQVKASTATMLVDRLAGHALVRRSRVAGDRRKVQLRLTPKGAGVLDEMARQREMALQETFRHLSPRERTDYLVILEKLAKRLQEIDS